MMLGYKATRFLDLIRASRLSRELLSHDSWTREQLEAHQGRELAALVRHAAAHSPFWQERLADDPPPILDKQTLMASFDEAVTDPRLRLAALEEHIAQLQGDELFGGEFRVLATSGTTGQRGVFAYSRAEWRMRIANVTRASSYAGYGMLPRRRVATVGATSPLHISARYSMSGDVGLHRFCRLDARYPLAETIGALNRERPDQVIGYPSIIAMLAEEQMAGRLAISPSAVMTSSEVRTEGMEAAMREAWPDARLRDMYGITEAGVIGADCEFNAGMHLFEDLAIFENVHDDGRPVDDGEIGTQLLLTDLCTRSQPKLRYAISDSVAITSEPCACGRPYRRLLSIAGRSDEMLELSSAGGGTARVHPLVFRSPMAAQAHVLQYQVVQDHDGLHVLIVPRAAADASLVESDVRTALASALDDAGAAAPLHVQIVEALPRDQGHGAKVNLVGSRIRSTPRPARGGR